MQGKTFVKSQKNPFLSTVLRFGDLDIDGYEDLIVQLSDKGQSNSYSYFLRSTSCDNDTYNAIVGAGGKFSSQSDCRQFKDQQFDGHFSFLTKIDSYVSAPFDFGETG